jgi:hypothetical protein
MIFLLFLFAFSQTPNCGCEDKPQITVLAVVNGVKITKEDLSIDTRTQVSLAQDTVIAARSQALAQLINKTLLEAEAKRRGVTTAKLLELEVNAKLVQPTEDEARAFYDQNKKRIARDFKHVRKDIIAQLRAEREAVRATVFANALRAGAQITVSEQPVTPPTTEAHLARVFATVNGVSITSRDIEEGLLPLIFSVQKQVYALRKQDLDVRINDILLEQEAKRLGTTPEALIQQNLRTTGSIATEKQLREFYKQHKELLPGDFDDNRIQILQLMLAQQLRKQVLAYAEQLRKDAAVQIYLTEPASPNLEQLCCNPVD